MTTEAIGQDTSGGTALRALPEGGFARRLGRMILGASEDAQATSAVQQAARSGQYRPAANRANRLLRDAERDLETATYNFDRVAGDFVLGAVREEELLAADQELEDLRRRVRAFAAAARDLESRAGIHRDTYGNDLSVRRG
jgi:hypothetical protein